MLLKKISRVYDPSGSNPENLIEREAHSFTDERSRVFALNFGSFYTETLQVVNIANNTNLIEGVDYRVLHLYLEPTTNTGKAVCAIVQVYNELVKEVTVTYQAVGGKYQNLLFVIEVIKKAFPEGATQPIYWNNISNLPVEFLPTAHMHDIYDFKEWDTLVRSLVRIYSAIVKRKTVKFTGVFDYLREKIAAYETRMTGHITDDMAKVNALLTRSMIQSKEWLVTDQATNPANYLQYGSWSIAGQGMFFGEVNESEIGNTFNIDGSGLPVDYAGRTTYFWRLNTDESGYGISLIRSAASVNEGSSANIRLTTVGMPGNLTFNYTITGIQSSDINMPLKGTITTNASGIATFTFTATADNLTEGSESLRFSIDDWAIFTSITINDTSTSIIYDLGFYRNNAGTGDAISVVNEGEEIFLVLKTSKVPVGEVLHLHYILKNGLELVDFEGALPTTITVTSTGLTSVKIKVKNDYLTEGVEIFGVSLSRSNNVADNIVTTWVKINDTSRSPTYNLFFSSNVNGNDAITETNEGTSIFLVVESTNVPDGSIFALGYGTSTDANDFEGSRPNDITIINNRAVIEYKVKADSLTEGLESLDVILFDSGSAVANTSINIYDTSIGVNGSIGFSTTASILPQSRLTNVNEGTSLYLIFNMPQSFNGISYKLVYEGSVNSADFTTVRPTSVTINDGRAVARYDIAADAIAEGEELFIVRVLDPTNDSQIASAQIIINDTSVAPTYSIQFRDMEYGGTDLTQINEGEILYAIFTTSNVPDGEYLHLTWTIGGLAATTANGDVVINPMNQVQVFNNRAATHIFIRADETTEGDEILKLDVRRSSDSNDVIMATRTIVVRDTSKTPVYNVKFNSLATGAGSDLTGQIVLEGTHVYGIIETVNVPDGTTLWVNYVSQSISASDASDFSNPLPSSITINNNRAVIPFLSIQDWDRDSSVVLEEELRLNVYTNSQMTIRVATNTVRFIDPTIAIRPSISSNGVGTINVINEGQTFYAIVETTNVVNGSVLPIRMTTSNGLNLTVENDYLTEDLSTITINNNLAIVPIKLKRPNPATGEVNAFIRVLHPGDGTVVNLAQAAIRVTKV